MHNKRSFSLMLAILAVAMVSQINTIAAVIMADLAAAFPDAGPIAIQYVMQMGMIGSFPISLAAGFLLSRFRIKSMIVVGLICIIVGGFIPIIAHGSLVVLYICAFVIGAGQGFMVPLLATLILQNFEGKEKDRMLGFNTAFSTGGATLLLLLAGPICTTGWVNTYYLYFIAIPVLIIAIVFLPKGEVAPPPPVAQGKKVPVPVRGWIQSLLVVLMFISYVSYPLNVAMLIIGGGLGDPTAASMAMSIVTVVGAVIGFAFAPVVKKLKLYIGTFAAICGFAGMLCAASASNLGMIYISGALLGFFFASAIAGGGYIVGRICKPEQVGPTMSISMSFLTLGVILSPIVVNAITQIWGGVGATGAFTTSAGLFAVAVVLQFIWGSYLTRICRKEEAVQQGNSESASA